MQKNLEKGAADTLAQWRSKVGDGGSLPRVAHLGGRKIEVILKNLVRGKVF